MREGAGPVSRPLLVPSVWGEVPWVHTEGPPEKDSSVICCSMTLCFCADVATCARVALLHLVWCRVVPKDLPLEDASAFGFLAFLQPSGVQGCRMEDLPASC